MNIEYRILNNEVKASKWYHTGVTILLRQSLTDLVLLCLLIAALPLSLRGGTTKQNDGTSIVVLWLELLPSKHFASIQTWCAPSLRGCTGSVKLKSILNRSNLLEAGNQAKKGFRIDGIDLSRIVPAWRVYFGKALRIAGSCRRDEFATAKPDDACTAI